MRLDPNTFNNRPGHQNSQNQRSAGEIARELVEAAMEHEKRHEIQRNILSGIFNSLAKEAEKLESQLPMLFNQLSMMPEGQKLEQVIADLTVGRFPTVVQMKIGISTQFTDFNLEDIKEMPGWIKIHEMARKLDVAVRLVGVTKEDAGGDGGGPMPHVAFDILKPYDQSDLSSSPDLPPLGQKTSVIRPVMGRQRIG